MNAIFFIIPRQTHGDPHDCDDKWLDVEKHPFAWQQLLSSTEKESLDGDVEYIKEAKSFIQSSIENIEGSCDSLLHIQRDDRWSDKALKGREWYAEFYPRSSVTKKVYNNKIDV